MKKKKGFVLREVCGEKVIVGEGLEAVDFGKLISLNETAAWLWEQAEGDFTAETLCSLLCKEYEVDPATAMADTEAITREWLHLGIIEA